MALHAFIWSARTVELQDNVWDTLEKKLEAVAAQDWSIGTTPFFWRMTSEWSSLEGAPSRRRRRQPPVWSVENPDVASFNPSFPVYCARPFSLAHTMTVLVTARRRARAHSHTHTQRKSAKIHHQTKNFHMQRAHIWNPGWVKALPEIGVYFNPLTHDSRGATSSSCVLCPSWSLAEALLLY